jgi:CBS domain containing-hemolysin-like protein
MRQALAGLLWSKQYYEYDVYRWLREHGVDPWDMRAPASPVRNTAWAEEIGFALVIFLTTYFSVVIGELVPKQLALRAALPIAITMARPMAWLAIAAKPFVWLLDTSSNLLLRPICSEFVRRRNRVVAESLGSFRH